MHRRALTTSMVVVVGLTTGCFGDRAGAIAREAQAGKTESNSADTAGAQSEAPPPDNEQPDTAQPVATSRSQSVPTVSSETTSSQPETTAAETTQSTTAPSTKPANKPAATPPAANAAAADKILDDETLAVETANRQFYDCLNQVFTGKTSAMDDVWSHSDRVTLMGPGGGLATGWDDVQALWDEQAKMKLGGMVGPDDLHVIVGTDLAIVECYEVGSNRDPLGAELPVRIRATNSFCKENGQWKMIGHHTDLLPYLSGPLGPVGKPSSANLSDPGDPANTDTIIVKPDKVKLKLID